MKPYTKVPQSNTDLAILLQNRGLVADSKKLLRILETVGYYRFTGYLHPFRMPNSDAYRPNTTLETVWDIYMFDRHLRLMAMDALARIEIAVRALLERSHSTSMAFQMTSGKRLQTCFTYVPMSLDSGLWP